MARLNASVRHWSRLAIVSLLGLTIAGAGTTLAQPAPQGPAVEQVMPAPPKELRFNRLVMPNGHVRLWWVVPTWEAGQVGFELSRREIIDGQPGAWERIGDNPIQPNFSDERLKQWGLNQVIQQKPRMRADRLDTKTILGAFQDNPKEYERILIVAGDFEWAAAFGMGWIDTTAVIRHTYEYRLSRVLAVGNQLQVGPPLGNLPLSVMPQPVPLPTIREFKAQRTPQPRLTVVTWSIPEGELRLRRDLLSFVVMAGPPGEPEQKRIGAIAVSSGELSADGQERRFKFADTEAPDQAWKYAIAPMDVNSRIGPLSVRAVILPVGQPLDPPSNVSTTITDEGVTIRWKHEHPSDSPFTGFEVLRQITGEAQATVITASPLPTGRDFYTDSAVLKAGAGKQVLYFVKAVSGDSRISPVSSGAVAKVPLVMPPPPSGLEVTPTLRDGVAGLDFKWNAIEAQGIACFNVRYLNAKSAQWYPLVTFEKGRTGGFYKVDPAITTPSITVRMRVEMDDGREGPPSADVEVMLPSAKPPPVVDRFSIATEPLVVRFAWWQTPDPRIKGFRLFADGNLLADEKELGTYARSWQLAPPPEKPARYTLVQVDHFGRVSEPVAAREVGGRVAAPVDPAAPVPPAPNAGQRSSRSTFYDDAKTQPWTVEHYVVNAKGRTVTDGLQINYHRNGKISRENSVKMGEPHGIMREYAEDGSLLRVVLSWEGKEVDLARFTQLAGDKDLTPADRAWLAARK